MTKLSLATLTLDDVELLARLESRDLDTRAWESATEALDDVAREDRELGCVDRELRRFEADI